MKHGLFHLKKIYFPVLVSFLLLIVTGCGSSKQLVSQWPAQAIQVDGKIDDWQGNLETVKDENYSIGFKNDNQHLYLCFTTSDRDKIAKIMRSGLNVVFESSTDASKDYTIRFPLINPAALREAIGSLGQDILQKEGIDFLYQELLDKQGRFTLTQKEFMNTIALKNTENIEVKAGTTKDLFVYELKVPLSTAKSNFVVGALPGEKINIKVETDPSRVQFREGTSAGQSSPGSEQQSKGGGGGGRGGRGGGGGNAVTVDDGGGGGVNVTEKFSIAFSVQTVKENQK
jgi:hypothetical protein